MLLLLFHTPAAAPSPSYINAAQVISDLWPALNAIGASDAVFWTEDELYTWFNEAGRRLSGRVGIFVVRDSSITLATDTAEYDLPDAHQATIQADVAGQFLRARTVKELEALDANWPAATGIPKSFLLDVEGVKEVTIYPAPDADFDGDALNLIMRSLPAEVSSSAGFLTAPVVLEDYFAFSILAEARRKESHAAMPEIAQWLDGICGLYEQTIQSYLGGA